MKARWLLGAVVLGLLASVGQLHSQDQKEPDFKKIMEMYGVPGEEHKNLEGSIGTWDVTAKMFTPGKEPMVSKGTAVRKWILDKHYVVENFTGDFMGQKFQGMGTSGYDRLKKKYVFTWIDNMGTSIMYSEGDYDSKTKTFTYNYTCDCPFLGKNTKARDVVRIVSPDEQVYEAYKTPPQGGGEFKMMELTYKRAAGKEKAR